MKTSASPLSNISCIPFIFLPLKFMASYLFIHTHTHLYVYTQPNDYIYRK